MSEPLVIINTEDGISTITLNRPQKLNSMTPELVLELRAAFDGLRDKTRVIILTGAGDRAFAAGVDTSTLQRHDEEASMAFIQTLHEACWAILTHPQPVIAAIHGYCLGGALEVAASCDLRIAADNSQFGMPEIKLGIPSVIEAALLPDLIGGAWANELVFTGDMIDVQRAAQIGLVTRVVPREQLMTAATALARQIASYSPIALRLQKELVRGWRDNKLLPAVQLGVGALGEAYRSGHPNEAVAAFREKRPAKFQ